MTDPNHNPFAPGMFFPGMNGIPSFPIDEPDLDYPPDYPESVPEVPAKDPPVPNRAWTEMKAGKDIDELTEEEKADLYIGHDFY